MNGAFAARRRSPGHEMNFVVPPALRAAGADWAEADSDGDIHSAVREATLPRRRSAFLWSEDRTAKNQAAEVSSVQWRLAAVAETKNLDVKSEVQKTARSSIPTVSAVAFGPIRASRNGFHATRGRAEAACVRMGVSRVHRVHDDRNPEYPWRP